MVRTNEIRRIKHLALVLIKYFAISFSRNFARKEGFKILLDTDINNFVIILKVMSNAAKNFDILATSVLSVHNNHSPICLLFHTVVRTFIRVQSHDFP